MLNGLAGIPGGDKVGEGSVHKMLLFIESFIGYIVTERGSAGYPFCMGFLRDKFMCGMMKDV